MPTPKTKERKCKCGNTFEQFRSTQTKCVSCLIKKGRALRTKADKKEDKIRKEKSKTLTKLKQEARVPFQKWIRLRDEKFGCISCGSTSSLIYDAGHFYKAELYSALIFDEQNCHKQCRKCNCYLNGNEIEYRVGLIMRYGGEYMRELENKVDGERIKKYERQELKELKLKYEMKAREHFKIKIDETN